VEDDPKAAARIIAEFREKQGQSGLAMPPGMKKSQGYDVDPARPDLGL
jgi:hypothetical protein